MIQTALYARVSSTKQQQQETIDSQIACLRDEARKRGWEIPEEWVFTDDGWSGSNLVRPALERLRDLAAQHLIERVLCLCPDRLARSYAHQVLLIEEFTRSGTEIVFVRNPVATTPEQALMVQVQGMIAEYERAQTAERTRRGKRHRARAGATSVLGRAPYGYRYLSRAEHGEATYAVVETEAAVVARIFHRYAGGGISMRTLADELTADRIPSPQDRPQWDAGTLGRMLRNPAYMGRAAFGKRQNVGPARLNRTSRLAGRTIPAQPGTRARPREEWIEIPVPALVTEEVFTLVQRRLVENAKFSPRNTKEPVLLQGLLVCDVCGYSYTRTSQGPGPKKYRYYRCPGTNGWELPHGKVCSSRPLRAPALEELVWKHVVALLADPVLVRRELERRLDQMRAAGPVHARQERLRLQITRLDGAIHRLVGAYQEELVTLEELRERVPRLRAQCSSFNSQLEALAAQLVDQQSYLQLAQTLEEFLARLRERAQTASVLERQRVLRAVVKEIRIGPDKITIRHSIPSARPDPTAGYLLRRGRLGVVAGPLLVVPADVAGLGVVGGFDPKARRRQAGFLVAVTQPVAGIDGELLQQDPAQCRRLPSRRAPRGVCMDGGQQVAGIGAGLGEPGDRMAGLAAHTHLTSVAFAPFGRDQAIENFRGGACDLFKGGAYRFQDQFQTGQFPRGSQDVRGIGALAPTLLDQSCCCQPLQCEIEQAIGAALLGKPVAEVGERTVVEAGVVQLQREGVCEVHAAADRLCGLTVRQVEQELQDRDSGELGRRQPGPPVTRVPRGEVLVMPEPVQPVAYPHGRRATGVARPRDLRGQGRDLHTGTGTDGHRAPQQLQRPTKPSRACPVIPRPRRRTSRSPTESFTDRSQPRGRSADEGLLVTEIRVKATCQLEVGHCTGCQQPPPSSCAPSVLVNDLVDELWRAPARQEAQPHVRNRTGAHITGLLRRSR